jgi:hypothetical protein
MAYCLDQVMAIGAISFILDIRAGRLECDDAREGRAGTVPIWPFADSLGCWQTAARSSDDSSKAAPLGEGDWK